MTLSTGTKLSHYEIISQIGAGGMGEVYQAKDTKLGRDVAIKVLPEEFAQDTDRVARFQREAKLLASLNHPNIAAIYGLEESDGTNFLVMELVEGQTLDAQIKSGPIPVEDALKLALQIVEALEAAHEKGVIHRDLKPANIKVTPDGKIKVLDFGLAKAFAGEQADLNLSNSPTLSQAATMQGVILGTAAYMSPEQARGKSVDKRTDIWAFGVVLFEMLTGRSLFSGEDVSSTLARVLEREPDFSTLPPNLHPRIRLLLERCLEKEPKDRYGAISDARVDIQEVLADPIGISVQQAVSEEARINLRRMLPWFAATLVLGAVIAGLAVWMLKPTEPRQVVRLNYSLPESRQLSSATMPAFDISPDGRLLVYATYDGLYLRPIDEFTEKLIPGTDGNSKAPFFSPDGKWIGYWSGLNSKLMKVPVNGGTPFPVCDARMGAFASWSLDNSIVFGTLDAGIMQVSAQGGDPKSIVQLEKIQNLSFPQVLPGGQSLLFTADPASKNPAIMVHSFKSGESKELFSGIYARYIQTGHLVYWLDGNLSVIPFDPNKCEVIGEAIAVVDDVFKMITPQYSVSNSGTLVYTSGAPSSNALIPVLVDKEGNDEEIKVEAGPSLFPKISPDGTRIAFTRGGPMNADVWIWDLVRKYSTRFTFEGTSGVALWTSDGDRIVYANERDRKVYWKPSNGTGEPELLVSEPNTFLYPWDWAEGGKILILDDALNGDIGMMSMEGDRTFVPLLNKSYVERQPKISPDGKWIAYRSDESGRNEVYVRPFPDVDGGRVQVSRNGGNSPLWAPGGKELFYLNEDEVIAVLVETEPTFKVVRSETLFEGSYFNGDTVVGPLFDISPDGNRFIMSKQDEALSLIPLKMNIVLNWFEELKEKVPLD